jgi:manganese transport protein
LLTRLLAILPAFFTIIFFGEDALGGLLILSQVLLSLQLGFAVIPLIHFNSDREKMREYTIKTWVKILAWLSALIIVSLNVQLVIEEISNWISSATISVWYIYLLVIPLAIAIGVLLLYVFLMPFFRKYERQLSNVPHGEALEIGELEHVEYKKIGITVDFSRNDRNTFRHALLQGGKNADYYLIHIVETAAARFHGEKVLDHETQSDTDNLEKYQQNLKDLGYRAHIEIGYGIAAKSISELVKVRDMDLLVMGAHGHKGISDLIFGTTVDAVRHNVNITIMIVK